MTENTSRLSAALADRYKIERRLGEGGMATVYLAEDLKHKRKVAVKVLRPELAAVLGGERFVQEITTTANLQHPHILPLFDSGEADSFLYYVMPFIDGETLRDKLDRETQLGVDEAVRITREVADALDYAHRNGIIHRDIKPENILLHDGRPMVADFGIALAVSAAAGGRMTETGLSLGTPHYMSPEQATAEKELTARADIYSLGSVLYEMLTGDPPHTASSAQAIIMKIVTDEARPITELRKSVPPHVAAAAAKALEKLPADRFESAAKFADALTDTTFTLPTNAIPAVARGRRSVVGWLGWGLAAVLGTLFLFPRGDGDAPSMRTVRFSPTPVAGTSASGTVAVAPDGGAVAFVAVGNDRDGIQIQYIDRFEAEWVEGVDGSSPTAPFFSPDGDWLAYFTTDGLQKVPLAGGRAVRIADDQRTGGFGQTAVWLPNDTIVFRSFRSPGLSMVSANGGRVTGLAMPDSAAGEIGFGSPTALPDGRLMFNFWGPEGWGVRIVDLSDRSTTELAIDGSPVAYLPTGHLLMAQRRLYTAVPFDLGSTTITGEGISVLSNVSGRVEAAGETVAWREDVMEGGRTLVWVDGDGSVEPVGLPPGELFSPQLSPDGLRLSVSDANRLAIFDLQTGARTALGAGRENVWLPDGSEVVFSESSEISRRASDASSPEEMILDRRASWVTSVSPDGETLLFYDLDIWALSLDDGSTVPIIEGGSLQRNAEFSPDGRYIAYSSYESGETEVYVVPYPELDARWTVSVGGGSNPVWARDGSALFYLNGRRMMKVDVTHDPAFTPSRPEMLFENNFYVDVSGDQIYDVAPDGRFLMVQGEVRSEIRVVVNWLGELREGGAE